MYTKQDIAQAGKSLSNTLSAIGSQIITNRLNNSRAQVLKKYQNPSAILYSEGGQLRNAAEIQAIVGQDLMWLTSNGFEDDAKMLQGYVSSIEKSLSTAQSNTQYVDMIKKMTGMQIPTEGMDMTRADLPGMYKSIFSQVDPNPEHEVTEIDAGGKVYITTSDKKTGKEIHTYEKWKTPDWYKKEVFSNVSGLPGPAQPNRWLQYGWTNDGKPQFIHGTSGEIKIGTVPGSENTPTAKETFSKEVLGINKNPEVDLDGTGHGYSSKHEKKMREKTFNFKVPKLKLK
jgi:hypothetical protein